MTGPRRDDPRLRRRRALIVALVRRVLYFAATLAGVAGLVLALLVLAPGDPVDVLGDSEWARPELEQRWNLDEPIVTRAARYVAGLMRGDLGTSLTYRPGTAVSEVIGGPALRSASWLVASLALAIVWATALAFMTARRSRPVRAAVQVASVAPVFLIAHLAVNALNSTAFAAMEAGWIDRPQWFALPDEPSALRAMLAVVILALGSGALSDLHGDIEHALRAIRTSGYVDAARGRGQPIGRHVTLNLLGPLVAAAANRAAFFVGGLVILEQVLLLNGAGAILWRAALLRDYDLVLGISLCAAAFVCLARLCADVLRLAVDPRLRAGGGW